MWIANQILFRINPPIPSLKKANDGAKSIYIEREKADDLIITNFFSFVKWLYDHYIVDITSKQPFDRLGFYYLFPFPLLAVVLFESH
jgi:hypothetical protein